MDATATDYNSNFYDMLDRTSLDSARIVVPMVMDLVSPKSVIDVGCGRGAWLAEFQRSGAEQIMGIDREYVDLNSILIDRSDFQVIDLSRPFNISGTYDLAVCLEVAEHLPTRMSRALVEQLTKASPVVLFSAAIPGQRGRNHINEQHHCFWHDRFHECGFECFDLLRSRLCDNANVAWWFRQNMFLYAKRDRLQADVLMSFSSGKKPTLEPIAPHVLRQYTSVSGLLLSLRRAIWRAVVNRLS